jgi:hypothetical protein
MSDSPDAEVPQVLRSQTSQDRVVDVVLAERRFILTKA